MGREGRFGDLGQKGRKIEWAGREGKRSDEGPFGDLERKEREIESEGKTN
jgi:hypothetical protein